MAPVTSEFTDKEGGTSWRYGSSELAASQNSGNSMHDVVTSFRSSKVIIKYSFGKPSLISVSILVEKLTKNVTESHIHEIFGSFGEFRFIDIPKNNNFETNRGIAYILYCHPSSAEVAVAYMHESQIDGAKIEVSLVIPKSVLDCESQGLNGDENVAESLFGYNDPNYEPYEVDPVETPFSDNTDVPTDHSVASST